MIGTIKDPLRLVCPRIGRGRVPGLEGADARRRDAGDVGAYRRGAPTKQMPLPSRNPKGVWGLHDDRCVARRRRCASTSPPPRALRSPCKPHARDPFEFSDRLLGACAVFLLVLSIGYCDEQKASREQGQFVIYVAGKEIGREKFSIQSSGDSVSSNSTVSFRDPAKSRKIVKMETELVMDNQYVPRSYLLRTNVSGQKGTMRAAFAQGEASFEFLAGGIPRRSGLLVGSKFFILDTNVFHHFIFIARMFDFNSKDKSQTMEVVIPQEMDKGVLKISNMGFEKTFIRGKNRGLHHLKADTGSIQIDLWVDDQRTLYKIALPAKGIEAVRD